LSPDTANDFSNVISYKKNAAQRVIKTALGALMAAGSLTAAASLAQQVPITGSGSDFNSVEYFDPPHQQEIKRWLSGAETQQLPGGLLLVKQVKIETFTEDGKLQLVAQAPECIYDPINGIANSSSDVHMRTGDGQLRIDGQGFVWRQSNSSFTISNQVQTVMEKTTGLVAP
jgi:hypothetical protein